MKRRQILGTAALGVAGLPLVGLERTWAAGAPTSPQWRGLRVGVASYSLRELPLAEAIAAIRRVGLDYVSVKSFHLPLESSGDQRRAVAARFADAGITPLSCGLITMENDEANVRHAFEYARDLGVPTIVCSPDPESMPLLDAMVKEFDIRLAIHNHGPEDERFPSPYSVWDAVQDFDTRIGLCLDVGHTTRAKVDPAEAVRRCRERLYDCHIKDLASDAGDAENVEVGRGVIDISSILAALLEIEYRGLVAFEYEKDAEDPLPGLAESVGYVRGLLAARS